MNNNRCVCCGAIIPEGRQVCYRCSKRKIKRFGTLFAASALMLSMVNPIHVQAAQHDMGTLMKDVNFDGAIDGKDATLVLTEYAHTSVGEQSTFTPTQKFVADTDFDEAITAVDASCILSTYAINSTDQKYPVKTVTFGVLSTDYQSFFLENAFEYAHDISNGGMECDVIANITVWMADGYHYVTYVAKKPSE